MKDSTPSSNIFVTPVNPNIADKLLQDLKDRGFDISIPQYTIFSAKKKGIICTLYQSGKLMVQGKDMREFIEFYLEPEILQSTQFTYQDLTLDIDLSPHIGIDESGKGDFFGPLCVAGVFAEGDAIKQLKALGVKDSKLINDENIKKVSNKIKAHYVHHIVKINPFKYNEIYAQFKNLNSLLAWGHSTVIEKLVIETNCQNVIIDQFASEHVVMNALKRKNLKISLTQRHRAEEDLVVAAASILARATFLEGLEKLGKEFQILLPKGASKATISAGKKIFKEYGREGLSKTGKLHFKTLDAILGEG